MMSSQYWLHEIANHMFVSIMQANLIYKCVDKLTPVYLNVTCSLRELCPLFFARPHKNNIHRNQELNN